MSCIARFLLAVNLFATIHIFQARPPQTPERILSKKNISSVTAYRKTDCDNILWLIDNQRGLLKCLLDAYKVDVQDVVFPESEGENTEDPDFQNSVPLVRGIPSCATKGNTFCEDVDNYPYRKVQKLLKENDSFSTIFGVDVPPEEFVNRVGVEEDKFLCEADHRLIFPKIGKTKDNTWQYIANQENSPEGFIQGVRIETCKHIDGPCKLINNIPFGYVTSCKQKYIYRRLLSLTKEGIMMNQFFEMPSSCCCSYKRDHSIFLRNSNLATSAKKAQ